MTRQKISTFVTVAYLSLLLLSSEAVVNAAFCEQSNLKIAVDASNIQLAGDVNKDGYPDMIIGSSEAVAAYVVLGREEGFSGPLDLIAAGNAEGVYKITGTGTAASGAGFGYAVSGVGDWNGDGIDDIAVSQSADKNVYIIFGKETWSDIDIANFVPGTDGMLIQHPTSGATLFGYNINQIGDYNGDGKKDIAITENFKQFAVYVLFGGRTSFATLDLKDMTSTDGIKISSTTTDQVVNPVYAGDVNKDGVDDFVAGGGNGAFLFFGKEGKNTGFSTTGLAQADGIKIIGPTGGLFGYGCSGVGDMDGDGINDFIVASYTSKQVYLIFGKEGTGLQNMDLSGPVAPADALALGTTTPNAWLGNAIAGGVDLNGDGKSDAVIVARWGSFVLYGNSDLKTLGSLDVTQVAEGVSSQIYYGEQTSGAAWIADINKDGKFEIGIQDGKGVLIATNDYYYSGGTCTRKFSIVFTF